MDFLFPHFDLQQSARTIRFLCVTKLCETKAMFDDVLSISRSEISHLQTVAGDVSHDSEQTSEAMFIYETGKLLVSLNVLIS